MAVEFESTSLRADANLTHYWRLSNAVDGPGTADLTNVGTTTFTSGKFDNAATFNGTSQALHTTGTTVDANGAADRAFSFWFKVGNQPSNENQTIFAWGDEVRSILIRYNDSGGTKAFQMIDGNTMTVSYTETLTAGQWYNIVVSYDTTSKDYSWWRDGIALTTGTSSAPAPGYTPFSLGNLQEITAQYFDGQIDDVAWFTRELTQADVNIINGITTSTPSGNFAFL